MAHTWQDDMHDARELRRRARGIANSSTRRRMQKAADNLHLRAVKKVERSLKQRVRASSQPGRQASGGDLSAGLARGRG